MSRQINVGDKQNFYTRFDPAGSMGNVHFLIPNKTEWQASVTARKVADVLNQPIVTLRVLRDERPRKPIEW